MVELRPYQTEAIAKLRDAHRQGHRRTLCVIPTGGGKTTVAGAIAAGCVARGARYLWIAHREELIAQAAERFEAMTGAPVGVIKAGYKPTPDALIQVASIDTLRNREVPQAAVVGIDESHRALAPTYRAVVARLPGAMVHGFTATPIRLDGRGLGEDYTAMVQTVGFAELLTAGVLLKPRVIAPPPPDLSAIAMQAGDLHRLQLASAVDRPTLIGDMVATWQAHAEGRRTVAFASSVEHSVHIAAQFAEVGVAAAHLDGTTSADERRRILQDLESGALTVVANYGVLTEGWDCPPVAVCLLARPTRSLGLYLQMVGRVERAHPGKGTPLLLDHAGCVMGWAGFAGHGLPCEERKWSLDGVVRRQGQAAVTVRQCAACFTCAPANARECPRCGAALSKPPEERQGPAIVDGYLHEVHDAEVEAHRRRVEQARPSHWRRLHPAVAGKGKRAEVADCAALWNALKAHAERMGYKPAWCAVQYEQVTGVNVTREVRNYAREVAA